MTRRRYRLCGVPPGRCQPRPMHCAGSYCVSPMAPAPQQNSSVTALAGGLVAIGIWRLMAVAAPHLGALILMLRTESDFGARICFLLTWGILNFLFIVLLRRRARCR